MTSNFRGKTRHKSSFNSKSDVKAQSGMYPLINTETQAVVSIGNNTDLNQEDIVCGDSNDNLYYNKILLHKCK